MTIEDLTNTFKIDVYNCTVIHMLRGQFISSTQQIHLKFVQELNVTLTIIPNQMFNLATVLEHNRRGTSRQCSEHERVH